MLHISSDLANQLQSRSLDRFEDSGVPANLSSANTECCKNSLMDGAMRYEYVRGFVICRRRFAQSSAKTSGRRLSRSKSSMWTQGYPGPEHISPTEAG